MNTSHTVTAAVLGALLASPVLAHHSTAANFNRNSMISVEGVVAEYRFQNPHVQIVLNVTNDEGQVELWLVDMAAKSQYVRAGWRGDEFKPGQTITVFGWEGYRERSMYLQRAILPDETEVVPPRLLTGRPGGPAGRDGGPVSEEEP